MKPPPIQRDQKLFENMAFAISFQSRKPGESSDQYSSRMDFSATIQKRIKLAGGRILENGFDELFEAFQMVKIQALALGLPCIAARWVTVCLDRHELVDWAPYLLCAGQSAFLGDAIRSRSLAPYEAATATLAEVISRRAKLLQGSRILAVVKKAAEGKKMAYVFLARVLGASLTRVYGVDEARGEIKTAEKEGRAFDWVYVDGKEEEEALFAAKGRAPPAAGGKKKRKRTSGASFAEPALPPAKRVRTLSDELVIQSLILGRLIEEGEMEG
ncbi:hypothetical protein NEMBOFW57_005468 [Staphylotrichum longicolle]|uniref:BRCT domain-containing protein n=1 Tax=Staphylotrichum longicolle TaxID=669026 RepID=A0AAD4EXD8_9PEZI|nr:hypothetical protein NEMBOFW57_005468 [Staphylotrichum longicolle]